MQKLQLFHILQSPSYVHTAFNFALVSHPQEVHAETKDILAETASQHNKGSKTSLTGRSKSMLLNTDSDIARLLEQKARAAAAAADK